jgi:hypothetical protein
MKVSTVTTGMPASAACFSGAMSCCLSVGAISSADGLRAITAWSTGTCTVGLNSGPPWNMSWQPTALAAISRPCAS